MFLFDFGRLGRLKRNKFSDLQILQTALLTGANINSVYEFRFTIYYRAA